MDEKIEDLKHKSFPKVRLTGKPKPQNNELQALMKAKQDRTDKLIDSVNPVTERKVENC